ncbi:MAG: RnfABCDGE type electron transport complex subunit D [Gammaproteobacteria bacterium]|nr:RnfABCDGE type electron transport complex subunit D [Gammaproteobacteria bacterium]
MARKVRIELRTSPHVHDTQNVIDIMRNVVFALIPLILFMIWQFGLSTIALLASTVISCLLTERFFSWLKKQPNTLGDWSAVITGILLALTLPPSMPMWMGAVGGFVSISLGKVIFGGLGFNIFNPALVGRAFVQAAFPVAITIWPPAYFEGRFQSFIPSTLTPPLLSPPDIIEWGHEVAVDTYTGATPLALQKFEGEQVSTLDLFIGLKAGFSTGAPAALILLCGLYLAFRGMLDWRIPVSVLVSAALLSGIFFYINPVRYPDPLFVLFSGGLMLGAWFMATDMVGSPVTPLGVIIFGAMIGSITVIIRLFGGMAEGIMYAILLANAATPLIEYLTPPRSFGYKRKEPDTGKDQ